VDAEGGEIGVLQVLEATLPPLLPQLLPPLLPSPLLPPTPTDGGNIGAPAAEAPGGVAHAAVGVAAAVPSAVGAAVAAGGDRNGGDLREGWGIGEALQEEASKEVASEADEPSPS